MNCRSSGVKTDGSDQLNPEDEGFSFFFFFLTLKTKWTAVPFCGKDTGQKPSREQFLQTKLACLRLLLIGVWKSAPCLVEFFF